MILAILFGILKAVGILLLILLFLVVLVLLILLFCPVCYEGASSKEAGAITLSGNVSWLWRIIRITAELNDRKKLVLSVRLFGIPLEKLKGQKKKRKQNTQKNRTGKTNNEKKNLPSKKVTTSAGKEEKVKELPAGSVRKEDPPVKQEQAKAPLADSEKNTEPEGFQIDFSVLYQRIQSTIQRMIDRVLRIPKKLVSLLTHLKKSLSQLRKSAKHMEKTVSDLRIFADREDVRQGISLIWNELMSLLRHVLPKKANGHIYFGTGDPGNTGMILAAASVMYPFCGKSLSVEPDFQNKILTYDVSFKGRIYGCKVIGSLIKLLLDKNVRFLIRVIRKKEKIGNGR